ncbi:MAG: class I SAM-dependent methyltransferase [Planctomycetaceae bacterium]|jgi:ubiquinone/menaquinone biosynthesis C-methylase UbiE
MSGHLDRNRQAYGQMVRGGSPFSKVATDDECRQPLQTLDGRGWLPATVAGLDVLCLAGGGGWQSILYATAGARVTVVDLCPEMLALDQREATRRGLQVTTLEASMDDLGRLADQSFDIVHQPVSTCYIPDICAVYREVARVLRDGGLYISQHKQPGCLQIVERDPHDRYVLGVRYYHEGPLPPVGDTSYREPGAVEFLHRWENLVGGMARAGLCLEDLREPMRAKPKALPGEIGHRGQFQPPYVRMKARRLPRAQAGAPRPPAGPTLWTPS